MSKFTDHFLMRVWEREEYRLELYDSVSQTASSGWYEQRGLIPYRLRHRGQLIFEGDDFGPSPLYCWDSDESIHALLTCLSAGEGDVEEGYFDDYTEEQLDWRDQHAGELQVIIFDWAIEVGLAVLWVPEQALPGLGCGKRTYLES